MKRLIFLMTIMNSASLFAEDFFEVTAEATLFGVFDNCASSGNCYISEDMKSGTPSFVTLKQGQLVWVSEFNDDFATVHYLLSVNSGLMRYGQFPTSNLLKVESCTLTDLLNKGGCK